MPKKRRVRYDGVLAQPLPKISRGMLRNDDEWMAEVVFRMAALVRHYEIPVENGKPDWPLLALRLAFDHVEGFQERPRAGRPPLSIAKVGPRLELLRLREELPQVAKLNDKEAAQWFARYPNRLPHWYRQQTKRRGTLYRWNTIRSELRAAKAERERQQLLEKARKAL